MQKAKKNPKVMIPTIVGIGFVILIMFGVPLKFWWYLAFLALYCIVLYMWNFANSLGATAYLLGRLLHNQSKFMGLYEKAIRIGCTLPAALQAYGWELLAEGKYARSLEVHELLLSQKPSVIPPFILKHARITFAIALWKNNRLTDAIGTLEQMLKDYEYFDADFYTTLGFFYSEAANLEKAREMANLALKENPSHGPAFDNLGIIALAEGKTDDAVALFQKALELKPNMVDSNYHLGLIAEEKGERKLAAKFYDKALACPINGFKTVSREELEARKKKVSE